MSTDFSAVDGGPAGLVRPHRVAEPREPRWPRKVAVAVGCMMLGGAALNTALTVARPDVYPALGTWLADIAPWRLGPLEKAWEGTFGRQPRVWGAVVGVGYEAAVGVLALSRDPGRRRAGLYGVALFKGGLLVMGLWVWAVPWLAVLVPTIAVTGRSVSSAPDAARGGGVPRRGSTWRRSS